MVNGRAYTLQGIYGNYQLITLFSMIMVIYCYVDIIWIILVAPNFFITYMIMKRYYPDEPVNIHIQSLINLIQENNWVIPTKKG